VPEPETKFCRLCGKNKPVGEFVEVPLARFENSVYIQSVCKLCNTVVHNIRTIVSEAMKKKQEEQEKPRIIVPSPRVLRSIRN
jgi:hypothetical protein